ncbi:serine/threonine-protein kinase [Paractinoplanes hotanensis]|uniref:non-specific serine/threonine protein kinase n=1 Tax=Paractinoplanes hotanensis TaxID=2906497 RepID=A0ABT0XQD7_9ACTN|nr:serine/threonine-protein kinase [Actinoplanes hotanensis]MCM4075999.1 serine/threonine protein kinase [Actinoplanes hotanensis]
MDGPISAGADLAGRVLGGRYELLAPIGTGGMAVVWQARDDVLARIVAVKIVATEPGDHRIRREARAAAALSHPNIAQVHDYGEFRTAGGICSYVVMELVEGGTLAERLASGPLTPRPAMRVCAEIAGALAAAHAAGLVHRDIKPANVMLGATGAKVVDFGIAAVTAPSGTGELDPEVLGTPAYLAPERLMDDAVEPASDVYALGVVLYRLLSGHSPWTTENTTQMLSNHIYVEPAPLPPVPGVPDFVTDLCERCLRKDPAQRPSAREAAILLGLGADAAPPAEPQRRPRWGLVVASAAAVIAAGATGWLLLPGDAEAPAALDTSSKPRTRPAGPAASSVSASAQPSRPAAVSRRTTQSAAAPGVTAVRTTPAAPSTSTATTTAAPGGPVVAPTTPASPPATVAPEPVTRSFSSTAGTIDATCPSPRTAEIVSYEPRKPFKVESASAVAVSFKHGKETVTMTVTCEAGEPALSTT